MEQRKIFPIVAGIGLVVLGIVAVAMLFNRSKTIVDDLATHDIQQLQQIFNRIDNTCGIMSFDHQKNVIDFLTVKSFVGSEVGSMNLAHPEKWEGPYVQDNPEVQGKYYQVVVTDQGYFITPGEGVRLANGKEIGVDIVLDRAADIAAMIRNPDMLQNAAGQALALPIKVEGHQIAIDPMVLEDTD